MNFDQALKWISESLSGALEYQSPSHLERETEDLFLAAYRKITGRGRTFSRNDLYVRAMEMVPAGVIEKCKEYVDKRKTGYPLAYLVGYRFFLNHEYVVTPDVLIPRFETEVLVFEAYQFLRRERTGPLKGLEIGLGSGIITLELLKMLPDLTMVATESSAKALECAFLNRERILGQHEVERAQFLNVPHELDGLYPEEERIRYGDFDFIISNPPYLAGAHEATEDVFAYEPRQALVPGGADPNDYYRRILKLARQVLRPNGLVFLEIPHERAEEIRGLFEPFARVTILPDLTQRPRVLLAEFGKQVVRNFKTSNGEVIH